MSSSDTITVPSSFQKLWSFGDQSIDALFVHLPGRVFVNYNSSSNSSVDVSVSTNSQALLDLVYAEVVPRSFDLVIVNDNRILPVKGHHPVLNLTTLNPDVITQGDMLITLTVNKPVAMLSTMADTIIDKDSLVASNETSKLNLRAFAGGSIFYAPDEIKVKQLEVSSFGTTTIQVVAPRINVTSKWSMESFSNSTIAVLANDATSPMLHSSAFSSGAIFLQTKDNLEIKDSNVEAFSSGSVNYYPHGACDTSEVSVFDNGIVDIASMICHKTSVSAFSQGIANIQTTDTLRVSTFSEGLVNYFNSTPLHLPQKPHWSPFYHPKGPNVHQTNINSFKTFAQLPTPPHEPLSVTIVPQVINNSWFELHESPVEYCGLGAAAFIIVALLALVFIRRGRRAQYKPLP